MPRKKQKPQMTEQEMYDLHSEYIEDMGTNGDEYRDARANGDDARADRLMFYGRFLTRQFHATLLEQPNLPSDLRRVLEFATGQRQGAPESAI